MRAPSGQGWCARRHGRDSRGSGSLLAVAILGCIAGVAAITIPLYSGLSIREAVGRSADASALAAADVAAGISPGVPCVVAREVAAANHVVLYACEADGLVITVQTQATFLGLPLTASARAGPPGAGTN